MVEKGGGARGAAVVGERGGGARGSRLGFGGRRPGGEEGRRPTWVRIVGYLIPCREDVMHNILIRCIGTHIYKLHDGATTSSNIQERRKPNVNIQNTYIPYNMYSTVSNDLEYIRSL
jgi:hypothetical protein